MAYDHAAFKSRTRRIVHKVFGIPMLYSHRTLAAPVPLRGRYHSKQQVISDMESEGYSVTVDGIERVVFLIDALAEAGIVVEKGATVKVDDPHWPSTVLIIDSKEPQSGPEEEIWRVVKG